MENETVDFPLSKQGVSDDGFIELFASPGQIWKSDVT